MRRWYSSLSRVSLTKQREFVEIARVFRKLQAQKSDFTLVPSSFQVPREDPWPEASHGSTITCHSIRAAYEQGQLAPDVVEELKRLNFVWRQREHIWDRNVVALKHYKTLHGHLDIPIDYVVPEDDISWPKDIKSLKLGMVVHSFRRLWLQKKLPQEKIDVLESIGFTWHFHTLAWSRKLLALKTYRKIYGNLKVPRNFVVPIHDGWPKEVWNLKLGDFVANWRYSASNLSPVRWKSLDDLGFVWEPRESEWSRRLLALQTYKQLYGHVNVPNSFIIPEDDFEWPEEVWDLELGKIVTVLRQTELCPERKAALDKLGFAWKYQSSEWSRKIQALQRYREIYGNLNVPPAFQVPRLDTEWPEHLWWMPLGQIVRQLRSKRHNGLSPERKAELDAIEFECIWLESAASTMGIMFSKVFASLFGSKEVRILILGLDNAGKTTILYRLQADEIEQTVPTIGFNVETLQYKNIKFQVWDLGGQTSIRPYWRCYYPNTDAIIYVVDCADIDRLNIAKQELHAMLEEEELKDAILLVFANKQDQRGALNAAQLSEAMGLSDIKNRQWSIKETTATKGTGLFEGFDWIVTCIKGE